MAKVKDILSTRSTLKVNSLQMDTIDQNKIWAHYDPEADSMVIYITGAPVRAVSVHVGNDTYLKVEPTTGNIVGFHVEAWERKFLPAHPEVQSVWNNIKPVNAPEVDWGHLLRMVALWIIFVFRSDQALVSAPQPA